MSTSPESRPPSGGRTDSTGSTGNTDSSVRTVACVNCGRTNRVPAAAEGSPRCGNCRAPLPWIAEAGDADFGEVAEQADLPVLVDLWATWCGPCRMVSPALEQVAEDLAGRIKLVKVDIDKSPALAQRFEVQAVPTLLILDHGRLVARETGAAPATRLRQWVDEFLSAPHGSADSAARRP
ncbi:thioredoxin [Streptomyces sp. DvalAA-14]|uniref:thioredoxin n=1 Tax=unclassified Streptomyces TaxID=2593676 RepID=UPI00081B1A1C|nr:MULTISPECIES: thioredoxin [unclassified Streptomyces]MYS20959.1 thioredoxin [Streptomyces sp. SID4948]SCD80839.1 thioredoxin [Streptomyces sp. DvalAA-14]